MGYFRFRSGAIEAVIRFFKRSKHKTSPLKEELYFLEKNYLRTSKHLEELDNTFWRNGGICCPSCGVSGYPYLLDKQERRFKRMAEIRRKLYDNLGTITRD